MSEGHVTAALLERAAQLREPFEGRLHERVTSSIYGAADAIAAECVQPAVKKGWNPDAAVDRLLTSRLTGIPLMVALLGAVFWITIAGANIPSEFLASALVEEGGLSGWLAQYFGVENTPAFLRLSLHEVLLAAFGFVGAPAWLTGFLVDGVYLGLGWVVAVMLPPMAIFFPLFTILEDLGYLPRVAFNMDRFLRAAGAHGSSPGHLGIADGKNRRTAHVSSVNAHSLIGGWPRFHRPRFHPLLASLLLAPSQETQVTMPDSPSFLQSR